MNIRTGDRVSFFSIQGNKEEGFVQYIFDQIAWIKVSFQKEMIKRNVRNLAKMSA